MRMMYSEELQPYVNKSTAEIMDFATMLINSENAVNWQKVGELVHLLRRSHKKADGVEVAKRMFEKSPTIDKLNQYFVAVADRADIAEVNALDQLVTEYLAKYGLGYQKHLYATWLKAANTIQDDKMFMDVYGRVPSDEKVENTYIISQYYVYLNRHSSYAEVRDHYSRLSPNIQNSYYVKKYYENASERMGFSVEMNRQKMQVSSTLSLDNVEKKNEGIGSTGEKKVFIAYGNNPDSLTILKLLLDTSKIPYSLLSDEGQIGDTIISAFEKIADQAALALVLCTPEDELKDGSWLPRQNVIYELGYFRAKLGANKACILRQTNGKKLRMPSDLDGVLYIDMDNSALFISKLRTVLEGAGFTLNISI